MEIQGIKYKEKRMEIQGIKYLAPIFDNSGYAEAARQYILALHKMGIPITLERISFEPARPDLGETGRILNSLVDSIDSWYINEILKQINKYGAFDLYA